MKIILNSTKTMVDVQPTLIEIMLSGLYLVENKKTVFLAYDITMGEYAEHASITIIMTLFWKLNGVCQEMSQIVHECGLILTYISIVSHLF